MGKVRKKYSNETLEAALHAVRSGRSTSSVSKLFGIPRSTLIAVRQGRLSIGKTAGPSPILTPDEENHIIEWMKHLNKRGFHITKRLLLTSVANLVKELQRENPFKDGVPGKSWYAGFCTRHPEIASQIVQKSSTSRAPLTQESLRKWFAKMKIYLDERHLTNIDSSRIFNCEESAFHLDPKRERLLLSRGDKAPHKCGFIGENKSLAALLMTNAAGNLSPPMVLFPYERLPKSISERFPDNWAARKTKDGWMSTESFFKYIVNVFEPWLTRNKIERPVILYIDGPSSHVTLPLIDFCLDHEIEILALLPNSKHIIQPCEIGLFDQLNREWKRCLTNWRMQNERQLRREEFATLLKSALDAIDLQSLMKSVFRSCGLCPFTPDSLNYEKFFGKGENIVDIVIKEEEESMDFGIEETMSDGLRAIESTMDETLLQAFRQTEMENVPWTSDVANAGLFAVWQKLRRNSGRTSAL